MKFLAIDTSGRHLTVLAENNRTVCRFLPDCAHRHSVVLMGEIDAALREAGLSLREADFLAVVVGPGSFTGIRIGISTVKGLAFAAEKPVLAVTSLDVIAYDEGSEGRVLALLDAGRGDYYAAAYDGGCPTPFLLPGSELPAWTAKYAPASFEEIEGTRRTDPARGLLAAVKAKCGCLAPASALSALYIRRSAAEEGR